MKTRKEITLGAADIGNAYRTPHIITITSYDIPSDTLRDKYMVQTHITGASVTIHSVSLDELRSLAFAINAIVEDAERTTTEKAA